MTHHLDDTLLEVVLEQLEMFGFKDLAEATTIVLNEAMKVECTHHLRAIPYERTAEGRGYANGFIAQTIKRRLGELNLQVPEVAIFPAGP